MRISSIVIIVLVLLDAFFGYFVLTGFDVVSFTSGGDEGISANPEQSSEGNIPGDILATSAGTTTTGGGGGGIVYGTLEVFPTEFDIELAVNTNIEKTITVKNLKSTSVTLEITETNLDNMIILGKNSISLGAGESGSFSVIFVASNQTGIFTGKIIVGSKEIPVSLNVRTKLLLFDSNIAVLNDNYLVKRGSELKTQVTLIPLGDENRLDVTLNYVIKDYDGKTYLTKSETILVDRRMNFERDFDTGNLPLGQYVVGLELIYPNGAATSSAHFEIVKGFEFPFASIVYYLLVAIILVTILIVVLLIQRNYREKITEQKQILNNP